MHRPINHDVVAPHSENDDLSFEQLAKTYSYDLISARRRIFVRLVLKEIAKRADPVSVLDIGCGGGMGMDAGRDEYVRAIAREAGTMYGVEPDESVTPLPGVFDHYQHALLETADLAPQSIDVAYSFMVMEHVADPTSFFQAVYRVLKPGGSYIFITPNGRHFFTRVSKALHLLRVDEWMLRVLRRRQADDYHYPVQYKCQTPSAIDDVLKGIGPASTDYVFVENRGLTGYFPGPLRPVLWLLVLKRKWWHNPNCLLNLIGRITKPG